MPRQHPIRIRRLDGEVHEHLYIIKLKEGTHKGRHFDHINRHIRHLNGHSVISHDDWNSDLFHGYAGKFSGASLDALQHHDDIEYIEQDGICSSDHRSVQDNASWGLARLGTDYKLPADGPEGDDFGYIYNRQALGHHVDIYIIDSGVYCDHDDFEGRARWGKNFTRDGDDDDTGHGTHCAGIAAGARWGVAKKARIIAVKVLDDKGTGKTSDIIAGVHWATNSALNSGRPSIINMSLGAPVSRSLNDSVYKATIAGVHCVVSAGNKDTDCANQSPACADGVLTVGASDVFDVRYRKSNWGRGVDIFAPGVDIRSCGIRNRRSTAVKTGTSMATPFVTGLIAGNISQSSNCEPKDMIARIRGWALRDVLLDIPRGTTNRLARNTQHM